MGQAKRRGTYEERKASALLLRKAERARADHRADLAYNERQRTRRATGRSKLAVAMLMAAAFSR
jgi:hypothetical protein